MGYVDNIKTNKANLVQMSRAGKAQELLDIKRYNGGNKNATTYQCYVVYIGIKDVATLIKGLTDNLPNGIILHDDKCEIFDMRGKFPFCHSSFSLDNQAKKLLKIDKEPEWYAYLAFMPNKK